MNQARRLIIWGVLFGLAGCGTTFYSTIFRVESTLPQSEYTSAPKDVIDGVIGDYFGWTWLARAVSSYETADEQRLGRSSYAITLQQVSKMRPTTTPKIDSLFITCVPSRQRIAVGLKFLVVDSVSYRHEMRRILRFGLTAIPPESDTLEIHGIAIDPDTGSKSIDFRMIRYTAKYEKFGVWKRE